MATGTIGGAECGAQLIQMLKRQGNVDFVVSIVSIVIYSSISIFIAWESWRTVRSRKRKGVATTPEVLTGRHAKMNRPSTA